MAAYAYAVTSLLIKPARFGDVTGLGMYGGVLDITNYNVATKPAITEISGKFRNVVSVVFGTSDTGFVFRYDLATNTVFAYYADYDAVADGALIQSAVDLDAGAAHFQAFGLV
ncbi:hypothetical protein LCGC14_2101660 [marine sediment metagenome]|uniref:Uncharacterized protein n=1 Tax=marine sediment metagenome TaxID=412755 RepID=A0A0F9E9Y9_9ZZZZ